MALVIYISLEGPDTIFFLFAFSVRILDGIQKTKGSTKEGVNIAGDSWQKVYVLVVYTSGVIGMKNNSCSGNQNSLEVYLPLLIELQHMCHA